MAASKKINIKDMVSALPEIYQPIYKHPEYDTQASRLSRDRMDTINRVYHAISNHLNRPLRVLDLGCAQGFMSLNLAGYGANVVGIDNEPKNIELCQALLLENDKLDIKFRLADIRELLCNIQKGEFDLVLSLSVFHHLCHDLGKEKVRELIASLVPKVEVALFEIALHSEPLYWNNALPEDPYWILNDFPFIHMLSEHATHLSNINRPLIYCSAKHWFLGGHVRTFNQWTTQTHELIGENFKGTRRYYFAGDQLAKLYRFTGNYVEFNRNELLNEKRFLEAPPSGLFEIPHLIDSAFSKSEGWIIREMLPGTLLSTIISQRLSYSAHSVLVDTLDQLSTLERLGLYHNDVRIWNILLLPDGHSRLIDFASISPDKKDCVWPFNIYLSFLLFARDILIGKGLPNIFPLRDPFFSPSEFPSPYDQWVAKIWNLPPEKWSYTLFREELAVLMKEATVEEANLPVTAMDLWMQSLESYLATLNRTVAQTHTDITSLQKEVRHNLEAMQNQIQQIENQIHRVLLPLRPVVRLYRRTHNAVKNFFRK